MVTAISAGFLFLGSMLSISLNLFPVDGFMSILAGLSGFVLISQILIPLCRQIKTLMERAHLLDIITPPRADSIKEDSDHDSAP